MARKAWDQLSEAYQRRLARGGITPAEYESGASLKAARGHATTPERPARAFRNPDQYSAYLRRRVSRGRDVPPNILPPADRPERRIIGDSIGWPGRDSLDVVTFTRSSGGSVSGRDGTMTILRHLPNGDIQQIRSITYNQADFIRLSQLAKQRGFVVNVVSVPSVGVTA